MNSFKKDLNQFLYLATKKKVIEKQVADKLFKFANSEDYEQKGWFNLSSTIAGLGASILGFGLLLLISSNCYAFSNLDKIIGFITLLGGSHFLGFYLENKQYNKSAAAMHFLGAGLFIIGVGLMAQMFNLSSQPEKPFLLWAVAIIPLAILLNNGPIAFLSLIAFTSWGNIYILNTLSFDMLIIIFIFNASICLNAVLGGLLLESNNNNISAFLLIPGIIGVVLWLYLFGFTHHLTDSYFSSANIWLPITILLISLPLGIYIWINNTNVSSQYFLIALAGFLVTIILMILLNIFGIDKQDTHFEYSPFGWTRKIYLLPLIISIFAWVSYFGLAFWGVIVGSLKHKPWMLNSNIALIGIGILTRFIDLTSGLMETGMMFILSGLVLFVTSFILERWRRTLLQQAIGETEA